MAEDPRAPHGDFTIVGRPLAKVDAAAKVTGQTIFADDLVLPRMAFAKLLRSPHPHARIRSIDVSKAAALPGVLATLVGSELPIPFGILPVSQDEHALALDKVRFVGDPVAAVAARDEETAEAACELIQVDYEALPSLMSIDEALARPDARIHDYGPSGNVHKEVSFDFGGVEEGFAEADHVREDTFYFEGNTHLPMEQHAAVAWHGPDGKLTLWSSTQTPHYVHRALAKVLEMPPAFIRIIACPNGGGFGGKSDPFGHEIVVARLSMKTARPVKITLTREEVFYCHRGRHPVKMWVRTGLKKDGTITAMHFRSALDGGAYGSYGVASLYYTGALQTVTYKIPRYKFEGVRVFTNKPPCGPKRGHGTPQPRYALECHIDKFCQDLGLDPAAWRLRNCLPPEAITANHMYVRTIGLRECLERVIEKERLRREAWPAGAGTRHRSCRVLVHQRRRTADLLERDAAVGRADQGGSGRGRRRVLRVDRHRPGLRFRPGVRRGRGARHPTRGHPRRHGGHRPDARGPRLLFVPCHAHDGQRRDPGRAPRAGADLRGCGEEARHAGGAPPRREPAHLGRGRPGQGLGFRGGGRAGRVRDRDAGRRRILQAAEARRRNGRARVSDRPRPIPIPRSAVELTADAETGLVRIDKVWIAHDVGRALNPILVVGQIEGSVYMALGEALMEEQVFRKGLHKIPSMLEYKSPTTLEMPPVESILVETLDPEGPYGAKECGQGPLLPVIPAVANALHEALGIRIDEVPDHARQGRGRPRGPLSRPAHAGVPLSRIRWPSRPSRRR